MTPDAALGWLHANHDALVRDLAALVAVPSISTDGEHAAEITRSAELVCDQMRTAGLNNVAVLQTADSLPYAYGEWLDAPGKPTVFLYAHHDVQPVNDVGDANWQQADPFKLTRRDGRLFGRGAADDKGAITAQLGAIAAYLKTVGKLPVNVKMLVEGEEEVGSKNLLGFFKEHKDRCCPTSSSSATPRTSRPGCRASPIRCAASCRRHVEVQSATMPVHSGMAGGLLADAALALNVILARLYWGDGACRFPATTTASRR